MTATEGAAGDSPKAHYGRLDDPRLSAEEMDERRKENIAYEYLCHLEEAKIWIEACVNEELPPTTELEEGLMNGVFLAKLGHFMAPEQVPLKRIYDRDQTRYKARGLHFRHTDNINHWLKALEDAGLPKIFYPETTDIYDRKNMPRVIYCIHALSLYLFKLGKAPQIQDLYGKVKFTDEEISAMRKELEKYGINMPAFSKIGGILANEMPVDEAALHAAVIAINDAIDRQIAAETLNALQNPAAHLNNIYPDLQDDYQHQLYEAKYTKAENVRNKSLDPDSSYIPDVYDELLTQAEIQGNINKTNTVHALGGICEALETGDKEKLMKYLQSPQLNLRDVKDQNADFYLTRLREVRDIKRNNNSGDEVLTKDEVQMAVNAGNLDADADYQKLLAVKKINEALDSGDSDAVIEALQNPYACLPEVHNFASELYLEEFRNIKTEKQADLEYDEIVGGVQILSAIAQINQAVDTGSSGMTFNALQCEEARIASLDQSCQEKYHKQLQEAKTNKRRSHCKLLTHGEVQQCINEVNQQVTEENERIVAVGIINEAIDSGDPVKVYEALELPSANLPDVDQKQTAHYFNLLAKRKMQKAQEMSDPSAVLWYEEIQSTVCSANKNAADGLKMSVGVAAINIAIEAGDATNLMNCLWNPDVFLHSVTPECSDTYMRRLQDFKSAKHTAGESGTGWMMNRLKDGHKFYFNVNTTEYAWERPEGVKKDHSLLTRDEIQICISEVTAAYDRQLLFKSNENFIIKVQARIRGYLARKSFQQRMSFMHTQLPAIVKLQSWWRMKRQQKQYQDRLKYLHDQESSVLKLQSKARMLLARKKYKQRMNYFKQHEDAAVKIQAFMRSNWAKKDYKSLMHGENPPISVVRRFVHLLDQSDIDYSEEIELQKLRQQVVTDIRNNQKLESDLNEMDIKIGLLVKNRITLQDVVSQHKTLKQYREKSSSSLTKGLKALSKQSRERLEAYQHLFYLLQTNPTYLAKLIFEMPQNRSTKFMESVILTLYSYASNQREEYLLLKLFKTALKEEIRRISKVDKMGDIVAGNPMVVKMIVSFNRNARGQGALRELLNPLVKNVVDDRNMVINTNPVEVYKLWVNQMESNTGKAR